MREAITISLTDDLRHRLDRVTEGRRCGRSEVVREALEQYLAREEFRRLRAVAMIDAGKRGLFCDEDVFRRIS